MQYEHAVSAEWLTTTSRPHPCRCVLSVYPIVGTAEARYSDMDVNGHLNHLGLEALHEDARARINEQYVPGTYHPTNRGLRLVTSQNVVHFLAEAFWPATIKVGIGIGGIGRSSVVVSSGLFLEERCLSVCDMTLVLVGETGPVAFPDYNEG
ncbi:acyl-CoA thioesterase [Mycobacterium sp. WUMAC-067]|nr:acyl-CoA thioesterase [Mycobacterium sp. WUMAC-067]MCA2313833.1 acyl-CoA thioesterase [Mycobacterium sp. WUMAC-025]